VPARPSGKDWTEGKAVGSGEGRELRKVERGEKLNRFLLHSNETFLDRNEIFDINFRREEFGETFILT
jgi:hypothetical protein